MTTSPDHRIPVTILTGFLGSGKTTLLNRILTEQHGLRIAVIENEFGEIGIDDGLVIQADEEIFEMNNGCICCTVRGDLIRILGNLVKRRDRFDYVLVETTGLADPGPVAQTFFVDDEVKDHFRLDGIVTLVDSKHVWNHIDESDECRQQIAFADRILLNKTDLSSPPDLQRLEDRLRSMNRLAIVHRTQGAQLPLDQVIHLRAFDLGQKLQINSDFLKPELPFEWSGVLHFGPNPVRLTIQPGPDPIIGIVIIPLQDTEPATLLAAQKQAVVAFSSPGRTVRGRGEILPGPVLHKIVLSNTESQLDVVAAQPGPHAVFTQHGPDEFDMKFWQNGQELTPSHTEEHCAEHVHDESVTSVGIRLAGELDPKRLNDWLGETLRLHGADIFRMKGILNIKGSPNRFVFQGVHMLFDGKIDRSWQPGENQENLLVFIGRKLNREILNAGFRRCLA